MNINTFLNELDTLYKEKRINKVEPFFNESLDKAIADKDKPAQFTILNEMMGFFRDTSQYEKSISACHKCIQIMKDMGIEGTADYATSLQNIANAHRAAGLLDESLKFYREAFSIYEKNFSVDDFRFASLYNNIALLYQEMGDFQNAVCYLKKALNIVCQIKDTDIEQATTRTNLGASLLELGKTDEAIMHLNIALSIFERDEEKNFHYSGALSAMAAAQCKLGNYSEAIRLYEEALSEIESNMGKGTAYQITSENLEKAKRKLVGDVVSDKKRISGLELSRKFYEEIGAPMIRQKFPEYENKIAVGLVGEGSERFGFDDAYSMDHDFGPGFCMWVTQDTFKEIGKELQWEYDRLPKEYKGVKLVDTKMAQGRCGVQVIGDFYKKYTGFSKAPHNVTDWIDIEDYKLATVTNGVVFRDDEGVFTEIRNCFLREPKEARLVKLARELSAMAQTGQANYGRCMGRRDYVTAQICISEFMQHTMKCLYILNKKYAPYYKWLLKGTKNLEILPEVGDIMRALADMPDQRKAWEEYEYNNTSVNENDMKALTIEIVAKLIINELKNQGIVKDITSNFLDDYVGIIMKKAQFNREEIINEIIALEFEAFDKVKNEGGRAKCQNNWPVFYIMRKSQYMTWTDEMLSCICDLWRENKEKGWNMIMEKYGRMMESSAPDEYKNLEKYLPEKSEETKKIVNQIGEIQVEWMKDFAEKYPKLAAQARDITSDADTEDNASYETYLKGELLTYSDMLLKMYAEFIVSLYKEGKNLAEMTIDNTVKLQGFQSLDEAEKSL